MKKMSAVVSLVALAAILGFSNTSWAVDRPNTPECADVNGRFDPDACHIQYIVPLIMEMVEMRNRLMKLQGKNPKEEPWKPYFDSPACDHKGPYYDEKFCLLQMPGKLALEKYRLRGEVMKLEAAQKLKRARAKSASAQTTIRKLTEENKKLAEKLSEAEKQNKELPGQIAVFARELKERDKIIETSRRNNVILFGLLLAVYLLSFFGFVLFVNRRNKEKTKIESDKGGGSSYS